MFDSLSKDSKAQFNKKSGELIGGGTIGYDGVDAIRQSNRSKIIRPYFIRKIT
jgi:hypothetical protein